MRPRSPHLGPQRRRSRPEIEGLEARDLPSGVPAGVQIVHIPRTAAPSFNPPLTPVKSVFHEPLVPNLNLIPQFVNLVYPSAPTPTPSEVRREYFTAKFSGHYDVSAGRFDQQALTIHGISGNGNANQFFHGRMQFLIFPSKPGAPEPLTGQVGLVPQDYLQAASLLILDLTAAPPGEPTGQASEAGAPQAVGNGLSLPTHLHWFFDSTSAGGYTTPIGFTQGGGYMDLVWNPDKTASRGTLSSGRVTVLYQGLLNSSSVLNSIEPSITK